MFPWEIWVENGEMSSAWVPIPRTEVLEVEMTVALEKKRTQKLPRRPEGAPQKVKNSSGKDRLQILWRMGVNLRVIMIFRQLKRKQDDCARALFFFWKDNANLQKVFGNPVIQRILTFQ